MVTDMNSLEKDPMYYKSLKSYVYENLRYKINIGEISPGDYLAERKLATQFNVSRTPVREALQRLLHDGLIEYTPDGNLVVKTPSIDDIEEICNLYACLVNLMIKHTIDHITEDDLEYLDTVSAKIRKYIAAGEINKAAGLNFDSILWDMSNLTDTIDYAKTLPQYWKHQCIQPYVDMEKKKNNILEHCRMVELLHEKDYDSFKKLFSKHIQDNMDYVLEAYRKYFETISK